MAAVEAGKEAALSAVKVAWAVLAALVAQWTSKVAMAAWAVWKIPLAAVMAVTAALHSGAAAGEVAQRRRTRVRVAKTGQLTALAVAAVMGRRLNQVVTASQA